MKNLKVSIISPSYNQGQYIEDNIQSVIHQNYPSVEHIVVDGGSTDSTVDILKKYPHLKWVSEKDYGQADALNKGLKMATGDIIGWLNSDDYYQQNIFANVVSCFSDPNVEWAIGNLTFVLEAKGFNVSDNSKEVTYQSLLRDPDILRQQPTFFRRSALEAVGGWNAAFHLVMDLDLWLRLARRSSPLMVNSNWSYFRMHEAQKSVTSNLRPQMKEISQLYRRENYTSLHRYRIYARKYKHILRGYIKSIIT